MKSTKKHLVSWIGTCVGLPAKKLYEFDDTCRDVSYKTFLKYVGRHTVKELNNNFSVPLHRDWSVKFAIGKYNGKKAICLFHSGIHHLWEIIR